MAAVIPITGLDVTVGSALGPAQFKRWVNSKGSSTSLGQGSTFLWFKSGTDEPPVTEVRVLYDDEPTPDGFKKLNRDVTGASGSERVFLAFSCTAATSRAITAVSVLGPGETAGKSNHGMLRPCFLSAFLVFCKQRLTSRSLIGPSPGRGLQPASL